MRIYNLTIGLGQLQTRSARNPPPQKTSTRPSVSDRYIIFNRTKTVFQIYSELIHYGFIEISIADWRWDQIDWPLNCLSTLSCRWTTYYQCTMVHGWACTVVYVTNVTVTREKFAMVRTKFKRFLWPRLYRLIAHHELPDRLNWNFRRNHVLRDLSRAIHIRCSKVKWVSKKSDDFLRFTWVQQGVN